MNNLDSLQTLGNQSSIRSTGSRGSDAQRTQLPDGAIPDGSNRNVPSATVSGNSLPQQTAPAQQSGETRAEDLEQAVERLSDFAQSIQRALSFSVDDITGQTVLTVMDGDSDTVIRQIPSEEIVELARKLQELEQSSERLQDDATGNLIQVRV